jgi:hypothetical protein
LAGLFFFLLTLMSLFFRSFLTQFLLFFKEFGLGNFLFVQKFLVALLGLVAGSLAFLNSLLVSVFDLLVLFFEVVGCDGEGVGGK